jgi:purine-binding chemotaxis protein CheW
VSETATCAGTYVLFRLGEEHYGLPVASVVSIIRYVAPTPVPRAPEGVLGVVNLRGRVLPVVDLGYRFSGSAFEPKPSSRIVVTECANGTVGIAVDAASEVATFESGAIVPVPDSVLGPETARAFVGMIERPAGLVVLLDIEQAMPRDDFVAAATAPAETPEEAGTDV